MEINFIKFHGAGNDFILVDNRLKGIELSPSQISRLCHRHFGIGADGLIMMSELKEFDFQMIYYNSDGLEGTMCGNGGRCIAAFARMLGMIDQKARFHAADGEHYAEVLKSSGDEVYVALKMSDVSEIEKTAKGYFVDTGSPHLVVFVDDIEQIDIYGEGKKLRWDQVFQPGGTNVDFVKIEKEYLIVRTFERGVENVTLSCGTGVTAAALAASKLTMTDRNFYDVRTYGGDLKVRFSQGANRFENIWLEGQAIKVYDGKITI
jgi:diaminopimelate epimerase